MTTISERTFAEIVFSFIDRENHKSTHTINAIADIAVTNYLQAYHNFAQDYISRLYPTPGEAEAPTDTSLSGCGCTGYNINFKAAQTDAITPVDLLGQAEDKSVILFSTVNGYSSQIAIPGCHPNLQAQTGDKLSEDLNMTMFSELTNQLINGIDYVVGLGGWVYGCDSRGERLADVKAGYLQQRRSTKANDRKG